ncbi:MAG: hypothetical protein ACK4EX_02610 [Thermaurantimonas sp.]|uniref:hypothetical protein n=1 Tax=Thermaurantimonas sp. TaxID=2681568 RepID=UPI00391B934D
MRSRSLLYLSAILVGLTTCKRGSFTENQPPKTQLFLDEINRVGENRLNSTVFLSWIGTDADGYVIGYEFSIDNQNWFYTTRTDSVFRFSIAAGKDTDDINFWIRAIDNLGAKDPNPAYLKIPLRNTPPVALFDKLALPADTAIVAATFRWRATDADGDNTITKVEIRANDGQWIEIPRNSNLFTVVLKKPFQSGTHQADVFIDNQRTPLSTGLDKIHYNQPNVLYIRAFDIANSVSQLDTSNVFVMVPASKDFLILGGQPSNIWDIYRPIFNQITPNGYDYIDLIRNQGKYRPKFWNPTFRHIISQYQKVFVFTDPTNYQNPINGQSASLLVFMAPAMAEYNNIGGKSLITTTLTANADISAFSIAYPIDGLVISGGQARLTPDSTIFSVQGTPQQYPAMKPQFVLTGLVPIVRSPDSEPFYRAQITRLQGWQGDNLVGVRRKNGQGNVQQVFFGINLHHFAQDGTNLQVLLHQIINNDFNW